MKTDVPFLALLFLGLLHRGLAGSCACATSNVNIRSGPGTGYSKVGLLTTSTCVQYLGVTQVGGAYTWAKVIYNGNVAWIATNWLDFKSCIGGNTGCPTIVSRSQWGAISRTNTDMSATPTNIFVHHAVTPSCYSDSSCSARMRSIQVYHINTNGWNDIGYSFVVGENGKVYEGRGWGKEGAHTVGYNHNSLGICVIGTFTTQAPNQAALNVLQQMINCAESEGKVISNYRLRGHRDVGSTACPGQSLYNIIKTWPKFG